MRLYSVFIVILVIILAASCSKNPSSNQPGTDLLVRGLGIYFRDSTTDAALIGRTGQRFHADSVKIFKVVSGNNQLIGSVNSDSLGQSVCNFLYVYSLVKSADTIKSMSFDIPVYFYFNQTDTDTITVKKQANTDISVFWNTKLVQTIPALDTRVPYLVIIKKK